MENLSGLIMVLLVFGVWYFLVIRPQDQERKAHEDLLASLAKDDAVVTTSGLHGRIAAVRDDTVVLEVSKGVQLTLDKKAVARRVTSVASS